MKIFRTVSWSSFKTREKTVWRNSIWLDESALNSITFSAFKDREFVINKWANICDIFDIFRRKWSCSLFDSLWKFLFWSFWFNSWRIIQAILVIKHVRIEPNLSERVWGWNVLSWSEWQISSQRFWRRTGFSSDLKNSANSFNGTIYFRPLLARRTICEP